MEPNMEEELRRIRELILDKVFKSGTGHLGGSLSALEFLYTIYSTEGFDFQLIMSKGHASIGLYSVIDWFGLNSKKILDSYGKKSAGDFHGHTSKKAHSSIALSSGSLGHGLPFAIGLGKADYMRGNNKWTICLLGDGEVQEGSTWESLLLLNKFKKESKVLVAIDNNRSQESYDGVQVKMVIEFCTHLKIDSYILNGNDMTAMKNTLQAIIKRNRATILILETIKGHGIKSMHGKEKWHAGKPVDEDEYKRLKHEISLYEPNKK